MRIDSPGVPVRTGLVLGLAILMLLPGACLPAGAASVRREAAPQFLEGEHWNTRLFGAEMVLRLNESSPGNWTALGEGGPSKRLGMAMAFDSARRQLVLFGGEDGPGVLGDTWSYDVTNSQWRELLPSTSPSARTRAAMVYDSSTGSLLLFGGQLPGAPDSNETWAFNTSSSTWTDLHASSAPPGRYAHAMAYDSDSAEVVLFGGKTGPEANDTWVYNSTTNSWRAMAPLQAPPGRMSHMMAFDRQHGTVILFGGYSGGGMVNDTWTYDLLADEWKEVDSPLVPSTRQNAAMDYDAAAGQTVLFGGWSYDSPEKSDTWTFDAGTGRWTERGPASPPSARSWHRMVYDPEGERMLLFGGLRTSTSEPQNDLWAYSLLGFVPSGSYQSKPFDTGGRSFFGRFESEMLAPAGTSARFQLRASDEQDELVYERFVGPDGTADSYYQGNESVFSGHNGRRWVQFKAYLYSAVPTVTPAVRSVGIHYNALHNVTLLSPLGTERWSGKQLVRWATEDPDRSTLKFDLFLVNGSATTPIATGLSGTDWEWDTAPLWRSGPYCIMIAARDIDPEIPLCATALSGEFWVLNNHPPEVTLLDPAGNASTGANLSLSWKCQDDDGDPVTFAVYLSETPFNSSGLPYPRANTNETSLGVSDLTLNRTYYWAVQPNDGLDPGRLSEVRNFTVSTLVGNRPPRFTTVPPGEAVAGKEYLYLPNAEDDDHDPIQYTLVLGPGGMSFNASARRLNWTPGTAAIGRSYNVSLRVTDGRGGAAQQAFTISVVRARPHCLIDSPGDGERVTGRMAVTGTAAKGVLEVTRVEVRLDGGPWLRAYGTSQWRLELDTFRLKNGEHRVEARSDDGMSYSEVQSLVVSVYNPTGDVSVDGPPWSASLCLILSLALLGVKMGLDTRRRRQWREWREGP